MTTVVLNKNWPGHKPLDYKESPFGWRQFHDITTDELFATITELGWAFSAHHNVDTRIRLTTKTFVKSHYLIADVDKGMSAIDVMERCPLTPTFTYSTPSHEPKAPRCRMVFEVEHPLEWEEYEKAERGLFRVLGDFFPVDKACWNVARVWYGAKPGAPCAYTGNILTGPEVTDLVAKCPVSYSRDSLIQPRPIRVNQTGQFQPRNLDTWIDYCVERWGRGGLITPRDSRHSLLLYIAFQLIQWMDIGLVESILANVKDYMVNVNNAPEIDEKEIHDICRHVGSS